MAHENPSLEEIERILTSTRTVAVVGASSKPNRPSNGIFKYLLDAGYRVIPVNPNEQEVHGQRAYPSLEALPEPVELVDVFRRPEHTPEIAASAAASGAKTLWLQQGIRNAEAANIAIENGLTVVMDRCIGVDHSHLGLSRSEGSAQG